MNISSLKQRLSLHNLWQSLRRVVLRFPVAVCLLTALTALITYLTIAQPGKSEMWLLCLLIFLSGGIPVSLAVSLWGEEQKSQGLRWITEGVALALWGVYSILLFYTDLFPDKSLPAFSAADETGKIVTNNDLIGKPAVIYFYPKDSTPGLHC